MAMKSPPGSISPLAVCREQLQNLSELGFEVAAASGGVRGNNHRPDVFRVNRYLSVSRGARRPPGGRGGTHPRVLVGSRPGVAPGPWVALQVGLRSPTSSWKIKNICKFWRNSENISRSRFSEIENGKNRELALGILSIG